MPLTTFESYLIVEQQFITHWNAVNTALGGTPATELKLSGPYAVANLVTDRVAFQTAMDAIDNANNQAQVAFGNLVLLRANLRPRLTQFRASVGYQLRATGYFRALPILPPKLAGENRTIDAYAKMAQLWTQINADATVPGFTPPLILFGGYTLANLTTDLAALRAAYALVEANRVKAEVALQTRDALIPPLRPRFQEYKAAVIAKIGAAAPLAKSIPVVSANPGTTPAAVSLNGFWDKEIARFTITKSDAKDFARYEYRYTAGTKYDPKTAAKLAAVPDINKLTLATNIGLTAPGLSIVVKCYVVTTTGNEKASNAVKVERT